MLLICALLIVFAAAPLPRCAAIRSSLSLAWSWVCFVGAFINAPNFQGAPFERFLYPLVLSVFGLGFALARLRVDPLRRKTGGYIAAMLNCACALMLLTDGGYPHY